jgi:hypothetical protein
MPEPGNWLIWEPPLRMKSWPSANPMLTSSALWLPVWMRML